MKYLERAFDTLSKKMQEDYMLLVSSKGKPEWNSDLDAILDKYEKYLAHVASLLVEMDEIKNKSAVH